MHDADDHLRSWLSHLLNKEAAWSRACLSHTARHRQCRRVHVIDAKVQPNRAGFRLVNQSGRDSLEYQAASKLAGSCCCLIWGVDDLLGKNGKTVRRQKCPRICGD